MEFKKEISIKVIYFIISIAGGLFTSVIIRTFSGFNNEIFFWSCFVVFTLVIYNRINKISDLEEEDELKNI